VGVGAMPQTSSMTSRTSTKQTATRRSVRVIMLDKQELFIKIEVRTSVPTWPQTWKT